MAWFIAVGCSEKELQSLNRVQKHQQVLFLSNILRASSGTADKRYLQKWRGGELWSSMKFPHEDVMETEMGLWRRAIAQVVAYGPAQTSLGWLTTEGEGHKVWEWQVQESNIRLFQQYKNRIEVYGHIRRGRYKRLRASWSGKMKGDVATVEEVTPGIWKVCSVAIHTVRPVPPSNFINILKCWGHTWIWNDLKVSGGTDWLAQAIAKGTLVAVTDRSYIQEHHPDLCLAAFVLECMQKRGQMVGSFPKASKAANAF